MDWQELLQKTLLQFGKYKLNVSQLLLAFLIYFATKLFLYLIRQFLVKRLQENISDRGKAYALFQLFRYFVWIFAILLILDSVGITLTYLLAGSAALFVGLGLGLQDVFRDVVAGIFILVERNVKIDDVMEVDGTVGRVTHIGIRTSVMKSRDGINLIIPNSRFINSTVVNWSNESDATRFDITIGVAYGSDERLVHKVLLDCVLAHKDVLHDEPDLTTEVRLVNFGDSSVDFELLFWTRNIFLVEIIKSEIRFSILEAFRQNDISIPFPQRDLHIISDHTKKVTE